jgi:hypothetical protein
MLAAQGPNCPELSLLSLVEDSTYQLGGPLQSMEFIDQSY